MFYRCVPVCLAGFLLVLFAAERAYAHDKEEGTVVKAGEGKLVLTTTKGQKQVTREVAKDAPVTLDGKPVKLEELKEGYHVAVALGPKHLVTKIEAHSKTK